MDFTSPRTPFLGRKVPLQSTYNSFCDDRGSLVATPPPPKRNKRNRSEVPLGSLETSSIIKAPPMLLPFDTKGVPSGRGGLSDEEILLRSKLLYLDPHPSRQENTKAIFKQGWKQLGKTVMRDNFTSYPHSRSAEKRLGGRSYFPVGEKNWHSCKSDAAFNQGVHQWPRRPLHGPSNGPQRCQTAPGSLKPAALYGEGPSRLLGKPWRSLDGSLHEIMLQQGQPVATLAELEAALCLAEQQSLVPPTEIRRRWQTLAASAISWSLDCLTAAGEQEWIFDQALQMLCTAEILTRTDVAETFGAKAVPNRLFLRALSLSGLGGYYQQRGKPRAAVRFLEQAVAGHAKFAHPAVLLNLCSAHLQLREPGPALSYLSQAVLALRSAAGRLCPQQAAEVDASATAATAAVLAVLGPAANPEDMCSEVDVRVRKNLWVEMDPLGRGIDLGEQQRLRVEPGGSLETPEASVSSLASQSKEVGRTVRYSGPRRGLGRHGLISKEHAASSKDAFQYEVDAAVVKTLLVAKVLLWPWPELGEEVQQSREIVSAYRNGEGHVGLEAALKSIATPGIAKHAAKLKKVWPEWGKIASEAPVPGAGLVLRECLLLTFVHAATALAQLSSKRLYDIWVVPPLREGLVLAIVLFGSKHPLALRLIHACQRAQVPQQPPAPPPDPSRLARPRPRVDPTEPKLRPKPPKTASVKVRARPKRPQTKGHVPAWNAGAGLQPEKEEKLHPAGQVPDAVLALAGGAEYMQAQSARRHGSSRPSVSPVRKDFWTGSQGQRAQEHLERQAKSEIRRELQRPLSSDPLTSRRRRPEATAQGLAPSSTPATPRSQTPETERG
ncbi:CPK2, partial [Symbiodinium necroappetens]